MTTYNYKGLLPLALVVIALTAIGLYGHLTNDHEQDAKISDLQRQINEMSKLPETVKGMTWCVTPLSGSCENNAVVQIEVRNTDGTTEINKIGITDTVTTIVSEDWKAVNTPTPVNSANSFIVWHNTDGSFHCKVQ